MYEYAAFFILVFTSVVGIICIFKQLFDKLFMNSLQGGNDTITLHNLTVDTAEYALRSALAQEYKFILIQNDSTNEELEKIIKRISQNYEQVTVL